MLVWSHVRIGKENSMKRKMISGKDLLKMGFPEGKAVGIAINTIYKHYRRSDKEEIVAALRKVIADPRSMVDDSIWSKTAMALVPTEKKNRVFDLNKSRMPYEIFGAEEIEEGARHQMEIAMKLPVTVGGALMPDAHQGYGLPIGGVLATNNVVIPYGVGMDIGCRMCLTAYPLDEKFASKYEHKLKKMLGDHTCFGREVFDKPMDHDVLARDEFNEITMLKSLKGRAARQIGTSGSGNHFVEFGMITLTSDNEWNLEPGKYLGVLSHSGSRGLGAEIARHYTKLAKATCVLPSEAAQLAWLDLDAQAGAEYWIAMNLAGDYAKANHDQIHHRLSKALGEKPLFKVENHHNFAWKEQTSDGQEVIVHRKGATPAGAGVMGIIPGTMASPGFIVKGKGESSSLQSASHGAGRVMSRSKAKETITNRMVKKALEQNKITLIGGGLDEAPMVYKDIHKVMGYQRSLVEVVGEFMPRIVRMCGDGSAAED